MKPGTLLGFLLAILVGIVAVRACTQEPPSQEVGVTRDLYGRWTTGDPRYEGRYLEITESEIVFGQGADGEARYKIAGVQLDRARDGRWRYRVHYYVDDTLREQLEVAILSAPGELQLETLPDVRWQAAP